MTFDLYIAKDLLNDSFERTEYSVRFFREMSRNRLNLSVNRWLNFEYLQDWMRNISNL